MKMHCFEPDVPRGEVCGGLCWLGGLVLSRPLDLTWVVLEEAASTQTWIPERLFSFLVVRLDCLEGPGPVAEFLRNGSMP
jgi:hypothetical protein